MKICSVCKQEKSLDSFHSFKRSKDGKTSACKECAKARTKQWQKDNPEQYKKNQRKTNLAKHGLTPESYKAMQLLQNNQCAICEVDSGSKNLHIDHDHTCCPGQFSCGNCIRGLLCSNCNTALGLLKDNPETIKSMMQYLGAVL